MSKLIKHKKQLASRIEDIDYVTKGIEEFPYGTEHTRIMQKIMNRKEEEERRGELILARFQREAEHHRQERSMAAKVLYDQNKYSHANMLRPSNPSNPNFEEIKVTL